MASKLNPYLAFKGNAREAIEFYHSVFGGKLDLQTFQQGGMSVEPGEENLVMHAMVEADNGMTLMASDTPAHMEYNPGTNVSMSLSGDDETELRGYWDKLIEGGTESQPLVKAPWGDTFGMLVDKFGIHWMVNIAGAAKTDNPE